jgi:hypothetical protein
MSRPARLALVAARVAASAGGVIGLFVPFTADGPAPMMGALLRYDGKRDDGTALGAFVMVALFLGA